MANDEIFIAGGSSVNSVSPVVNIFTPRDSSWEQIQLPTARKSIVAASLGSTVLFAGGLDQQNQPYNSVDIFDFRARRWVTLDFDTRHVIKGAVIAQSQAFLYTEQDELVIVNPTSNSTSTLSHAGRFIDAVSNATHIFFLVYQGNIPNVEIFNIDAGTWTSVPSSAPFTEIDRIFHVSNLIVLVGRQQGHAMSPRTTFQRTFTFSNDASDVAKVVNVGTDLFFLTRDSVTVATMPQVSTATYNINRTAVVESNLVVHNNIVYFTGLGDSSDSATELFRFELNQLFQRVDIRTFLTTPTDAEWGFLFWLQPAIGTIATLNLRLRRIDVFHTNLRDHSEAIGVRVNSDYVIVASDPHHLGEAASSEYDVFNFNTQRVTTRRMPNAFAATSGVSAGNYAVFTTASNFLHVYEAGGIWFRLFSAQPTQFAALIEDNIIMVHASMIETYDLHTREIRKYNVTRPSGDKSTSKYFATLFRVFICDRTATGGTAIATYRHTRRGVVYHQIDYPIESIVEVHGYVVFNVITPSHPQKMFVYYFEDDNGSHDVREIPLPVNEASPYDKRPVMYASTGEFLYLVRPFRVDVLDVTDWTVTHVPSMVIGQPLQVLLLGSKLVIHHSLNDVQHLLVYERSTQETQSIEFRGLGGTPFVFATEDNFIYTLNSWRFQVMPFTSITFALRDSTEFLGQTALFAARAISAVGDLSTTWRHNSQLINNAGTTLRLQNVTEDMAGEYSVEVRDLCGHRAVSSARLNVNGKPVFTAPLQYSTILCHEPTAIEVNVTGARVSYTWTINGIDHDGPETSVIVHEDKIECNSESTLCVMATNPAGSSSSCAQVRVLPIESVFKGPASVTEQPNWFAGSEATLHVSVLDDHCTSHEWFMEGTSLGRFYSAESTLNVNVTRDIEQSKIFVRTYCGSGVIASRAFSFNQVSVLSVKELAVIIVAASVVFIAAIIIVIVVAKKKNSTAYKKLGKYELQTLSAELL